MVALQGQGQDGEQRLGPAASRRLVGRYGALTGAVKRCTAEHRSALLGCCEGCAHALGDQEALLLGKTRRGGAA